jgi:hypothetical protein
MVTDSKNLRKDIRYPQNGGVAQLHRDREIDLKLHCIDLTPRDVCSCTARFTLLD